MSNEYHNFTSPRGRLVAGSAFQGSDKLYDGKTRTDRDGNPVVRYFMALAVRKDDPELPAFIQLIKDAAKAEVPNKINHPNFTWKMVDGDTEDKVGYKGCMVFKFDTGIKPKVYTRLNPDYPGDPVLTENPDDGPRGYYMRVAGTIAGNNHDQNPGVFLNHQLVEVFQAGEIIRSGPTAEEAFGDAPAPVPVENSSTSAPPLANDFLGAGAAPPADDDAPAPPATVEPSRIHNGKVYTEAKLKASGWTDAQIAALPKA